MATTTTLRVSGSPSASATARVTGSPSDNATQRVSPVRTGFWSFRAYAFAAKTFQCPLSLGRETVLVGGTTTARVTGI